MNYAHDLVSRMAEERPVQNADFFPGYSNWLNQRFLTNGKHSMSAPMWPISAPSGGTIGNSMPW